MSRDHPDPAVAEFPPGVMPEQEARLRSLGRYAHWRTGGEDFDDIARLAALVCRTPLASIAIVRTDEVFHQAEFGWGAGRESDLQDSFARFVVAAADVVVIDNLLSRPEFSPSAHVRGDMHLRFAAGVPLLAGHHPIGTLCVFDRIARDLSDEAVLALKALARQCVSHLELRRSLRIEREAEERLRFLFESARDYAIISLGLDGRVQSWNAGAALIFGWTEAEAEGQHISLIFPPLDAQAGVADADLRKAAAQGREIHERYYRRKDRSSFWGTGETMPLLAADGGTRGFLTILRDRTAQKRMKEALEYQTGVLQAITDHLTEALFQVDVDHRITFVNPAAERLFGWTRNELVGVNLHDRLHYHFHDQAGFHREDCAYVMALKRRETLVNRPDIFVHRDGHLIDVIASFAPIISEGIVTGAVITLENATETKRIAETLRRTQERYQLAVVASGIIGSWDWDLRARTVVADATFAEQYGVDPGEAEKGAPLEEFVNAIHPDDRTRVFDAIDESIATKEPFVGEYRLLRADGSIRWIAAHARCYYDEQGKPVRYPGLSVDITPRKREEQRRAALLELEDRLRNEDATATIAGLAAEILCRLLATERAGFCTIDATGHYATVERDYVSDGGESLAGTYKLSKFENLHEPLTSGRSVIVENVDEAEVAVEDRARWRALGVGALVYMPLAAEGRIAAIFYVHSTTPRSWPPEDIALIANVSDRTWAAITRAQGLAQQKILSGELRHRMKNTMAMVLAIAGQTMRKAATREEAYEAFEARILALDEAQNILMRSSWSTATMKQIVTGALAPHRPATGDRFVATGPAVNLSAQTALSFALALHELATNATKYGALSNDTGRVMLDWCVEERAEEPVFLFVWKERGGPPVAPPTHKGFGSRLIKGSFARTIKVEIDYESDGFRCTFTAPLTAL